MSRDGRRKGAVPTAVVLVVVILATAAVGLGLSAMVGNVAATSSPTQSDNATIQNVTVEGEGHNETQYEMVADHQGPPFVWQDGELRLNATIASRADSGSFYLCGRAFDEDGESTVDFECERFGMAADGTKHVQLSIDEWPENATGNHTIVVQLYKSSLGTDDAVHETALQVTVIERGGDLTGDGLKNEEEFVYGTDFTRPDTSGNGLTDWEEVKKYGTDPLKLDTTGDGINDATLVRFGLDPTVPYLLHRYLIGGMVLLLAAVGGGVTLIRRRRAAGPSSMVDGRGPESGASRFEPYRGADGGETEGEQRPTLDESILTNEEVVCRLLERNEGRMRQSQVVDATEWSKAKVSRVLSDLEDQGVINRIRIGRENVVDLESDVEGAAMPNGREHP